MLTLLVLSAFAAEDLATPRARALDLYSQALVAEAEGDWVLALEAWAADPVAGQAAVVAWTRRWTPPQYVEARGVHRVVDIPHRDEVGAMLAPVRPPRDQPLTARDLTLVPVEGADGVAPLWVATTEVTQRTWMTVMGRGVPTCDDCPVFYASLEDAADFCNRLSAEEGLEPVYAFTDEGVTRVAEADGYRLPTLEEYQHVLWMGGPPRKRPAGVSTRASAWLPDRSAEVKPVGSMEPNPWGLYDLFGNAAELVWHDDPRYDVIAGYKHPWFDPDARRVARVRTGILKAGFRVVRDR